MSSNIAHPVPASTFQRVESLARLASFATDTLRLTDTETADLLHAFNDRQDLALPAAFVDELSWTFARPASPLPASAPIYTRIAA